MDKQQTISQEQLAANVAHIRSVIAEAAQRVGRMPSEITLVAVSKTVPIELVRMAYNLNALRELRSIEMRSIEGIDQSRPYIGEVTNFGENRVQDAIPKSAAFHQEDVRWHMIGHLQSNKAAKVVGAFDTVQSVDSLHQAQALNRHAEELGTNPSLQRHFVSTASPSAAMIGEGITYCPRCGAALPRPTVACARRSCRPAALRLVRLQPVDTESKMNVVLPSSLSQADPEPQPADPVTPLSVVTPALQQQLSLEENSR